VIVVRDSCNQILKVKTRILHSNVNPSILASRFAWNNRAQIFFFGVLILNQRSQNPWVFKNSKTSYWLLRLETDENGLCAQNCIRKCNPAGCVECT